MMALSLGDRMADVCPCSTWRSCGQLSTALLSYKVFLKVSSHKCGAGGAEMPMFSGRVMTTPSEAPRADDGFINFRLKLQCFLLITIVGFR